MNITETWDTFKEIQELRSQNERLLAVIELVKALPTERCFKMGMSFAVIKKTHLDKVLEKFL
jgi:hypothetical protein